MNGRIFRVVLVGCWLAVAGLPAHAGIIRATARMAKVAVHTTVAAAAHTTAKAVTVAAKAVAKVVY